MTNVSNSSHKSNSSNSMSQQYTISLTYIQKTTPYSFLTMAAFEEQWSNKAMRQVALKIFFS